MNRTEIAPPCAQDDDPATGTFDVSQEEEDHEHNPNK